MSGVLAYLLRGFVTCAVLAAMAVPTHATDTLVKLTKRHAQNGWEAVGRLDVSGAGYCTATLIAPDQVLTAAHCVLDDARRVMAPAQMTFRAGYRDGHFVASRQIRRVIVHPAYAGSNPLSLSGISTDLAVLELATPIPDSTARPFEVRAASNGTHRFSVLSYGRGRDDAPSWQDSCAMLERKAAVLLFDCSVTFGSSGAPIFAQDGADYVIVSVVSAKSNKGPNVAYGMELTQPVTVLRSALKPQLGQTARRTLPTVRAGTRNRSSGAKFVRP